MIGREVNKIEIAERLIQDANNKKNNLIKKKFNKKLLLLEWIDPYFSPGHWIPEQIEIAGFQSVVGKKGEKSVELSAEKINELNPDYIGLICCGYNLEENKFICFSNLEFRLKSSASCLAKNSPSAKLAK